jgi:ribonuclease P protein component
VQTLKSRADFLKIGKQGKRCVSHGVIVQAMPNEVGEVRVGYTITKKTEKSAVKRNRIKRRLRAAAAEIMDAHAKTSCDYVLIGRPATSIRPYKTLCEDIKWCLGKIGYAK